jgi:hypothetical protein
VAILHRAELRPTKLELLNAWLPSQPWYAGPSDAPLESVGTYRFDDPAGEVGIETILVRAGDGPIMQVPLTYRGAPLEGGEPWLVGTMEHSVLGPRWAYDACADPIFATALATTIVEGEAGAEQYFEVEGRREPRKATVDVRGSGAPGTLPPVGPTERVTCRTEGSTTVIEAGDVELAVRRLLDPAAEAGDGLKLTGTWDGQEQPAVLAVARLR